MQIRLEDFEFYKNKLVVYRIFNIKSNKGYIGKCSHGLNRIKDHLTNWSNPKQDYRAKLLYRAMRKYDSNKFNYEILHIALNEDELSQKEMEFIKKFNTTNIKFGYNLTDGGSGGNTIKYKTKIEKIEIGKKVSNSNKLNYKNHPERAENQRNVLRVIRNDPIKSLKNRQITSERMKKMNQEDPRFLAVREKRKVKVQCIETGKIYNSMADAAKDIGVSGGGYISTAIKLNIKIKNLYTFRKYKCGQD